MSGYFEIGIYHTKTNYNVGTLWRSAYQLGAAGIFTIGRRYKREASDTVHAADNIPLRHFDNIYDFLNNRPVGAQIIGIEMNGEPLATFKHPRNAIYILGAEDAGLSNEMLSNCNKVISLDAIRRVSYNVAVAGSIVMYHRMFMDGRK